MGVAENSPWPVWCWALSEGGGGGGVHDLAHRQHDASYKRKTEAATFSFYILHYLI